MLQLVSLEGSDPVGKAYYPLSKPRGGGLLVFSGLQTQGPIAARLSGMLGKLGWGCTRGWMAQVGGWGLFQPLFTVPPCASLGWLCSRGEDAFEVGLCGKRSWKGFVQTGVWDSSGQRCLDGRTDSTE